MATATKSKKAATFDVTAEQLDAMDVETSERMAKIRQGKSRAKVIDAAPVSAGQLLDGVEVIEERDVEYSKIKRSKENPRTTFDEELIAEMAPTIETICRLNPLTVREGTYELIDGETRHRAGEVGKAEFLRCKIVRCTDAQAACIRILTSVQRRDLNAIDRAVGIKALQEQHGLSQRQLQDVLKMQQGSISNLTRLLDLPDAWRAKVISGEITPTAARELCPWADEPAVLATLDKELSKHPSEERNIALTEVLNNVVFYCGRPLKDNWYYDRSLKQPRSREVKLNPTDEQREQLRIRKLKRYGEVHELAFNVELWEQLQNADEQRRAAAERKKIDAESKSAKSGNEKPDAKQAAANREKQREQLNKRLYRYKVAWLQARLVETVSKSSNETLMKYALFFALLEEYRERAKSLMKHLGLGALRDGYHTSGNQLKGLMGVDTKTLWDSARDVLREWLSGPFDAWSSAMSPEAIEALAESADIDIERDWPATCKGAGATSGTILREYLELLNKDQLGDLIAEWKLDPGLEGAKRGVTIENIDQVAKGKPLPKSLANVKRCEVR